MLASPDGRGDDADDDVVVPAELQLAGVEELPVVAVLQPVLGRALPAGGMWSAWLVRCLGLVAVLGCGWCSCVPLAPLTAAADLLLAMLLFDGDALIWTGWAAEMAAVNACGRGRLDWASPFWAGCVSRRERRKVDVSGGSAYRTPIQDDRIVFGFTSTRRVRFMLDFLGRAPQRDCL